MTIKMENGDHDLLIQIATDIKWVKDTMVSHMKEDSALFSKVEAIANAAHKRIDCAQQEITKDLDKKFNGLMISGVLSLIVLAITMFIKK